MFQLATTLRLLGILVTMFSLTMLPPAPDRVDLR
jgi:hypothetical protein